MTRTDLEAEFTQTLAPHFPEGVPVSLVASLSLAASGYTATQVERHARPHPWPPRRQRQDEGQDARRRREEEARSA
jgi:hypothetical protein